MPDEVPEAPRRQSSQLFALGSPHFMQSADDDLLFNGDDDLPQGSDGVLDPPPDCLSPLRKSSGRSQHENKKRKRPRSTEQPRTESRKRPKSAKQPRTEFRKRPRSVKQPLTVTITLPKPKSGSSPQKTMAYSFEVDTDPFGNKAESIVSAILYLSRNQSSLTGR
jgi:hypothetical protein